MPAEPAVHPLFQFVPFLFVFAIFYFLVFKPQKDKQKEQKKMLDNLKKNDEVVTIGGIHGTIVNIKEKTVIVRIDDSVKIEIDREAVASVTKSQS